MNTLLAFFENKIVEKKAKFVGFVAALCALFLSIDQPTNSDAKSALDAIQLFWLVILTIVVTSLFFDLVKFFWRKERAVSRKYGLPMTFPLSSFLGLGLLGIILEFWRYIVALHGYEVAYVFITYCIPVGVVAVCLWADIQVQKNQHKVRPIFQLLVDSLIMGVLTGVAGIYIEAGITKMVYLFWITLVMPATFVLVFGLLFSVAKYKGVKMLKYPRAT